MTKVKKFGFIKFKKIRKQSALIYFIFSFRYEENFFVQNVQNWIEYGHFAFFNLKWEDKLTKIWDILLI